jgi:hypothetical protein
VGGVTPSLGLLAGRHAGQARGEAGVIKQIEILSAEACNMLPCGRRARRCRRICSSRTPGVRP